ncbi:MAG: alkaline phosphatase D family protein [Acidimicrobiia bacterium]
MSAVASFLHRRRPLLPLAPEVVRLLHRVSLMWALGVVVALEAIGRAGWLAYRPGFAAYEIVVRPLFVGLFVLGAALAWRWEVVGGMLATFTSAGMVVWYGRQLAPWNATIVLLAFAVPGLAWLLLDLHDQRPRLAVAGVAVALVAGGVGIRVGDSSWDDHFGPTHPDSTAQLPDGTVVDWLWIGGVTARSATIVARPDRAGDWSTVLRATSTDDVTVVRGVQDGDVVRFEIVDLEPDTEYGVALVDRDDRDGGTVQEATFTTFPEGRADITIAVGSCMRVGSNGAVFDTIAGLDPTLFIQASDFHYANIGEDDPDEFRAVMDVNLSEPGPSALFRSVPIAYVWDDHDYGANNADTTSPSRPAAIEVYRQYVPSYVTTDPDDGIYQAFDVGDVRVIMTDSRSARSPADQVDDADKTMLGAEQRAWLEAELLAARDTYALTIWVSPIGWIGEAAPGRRCVERLQHRAARARELHRRARHRPTGDAER